MSILEDRPEEVAELWDQYQNDPRPFPLICNEHFLRTDIVYAAFDLAGYPWRAIKHPMTCARCGKVFLQILGRERYCSVICQQVHKREAGAPSRYSNKKKKQQPIKSIQEIAAEARKHGMTYGQYVTYLGGR